MTTCFDSELEERLVRYCAVDTQSDADSPTSPSTACQLDLSRMLMAELDAIGATDIRLTDYGVVLATVPASKGVEAPVMGWLAHVDTAPQFNATGVKPVVHRRYNGGDITFADDPNLRLSPDNVPYLREKQGEDIITASGLTLLGGDDKAGVAIIMTAARHLLENPDIAHGEIRLAFTPDEEIGRGVTAPLPADLAVDFAFTFDGGNPGEVVYETFSANAACVKITGVSIHPGSSKDVMVNALHLGAKVLMTLPHVTMTPETTSELEGFIHAGEMNGDAAACELRFILRAFEMEELDALGALVKSVCDAVALSEPRAQVSCEITTQYRNMRYWLEDDMTAVELARTAMRDAGMEPFSKPIRGGTDGSILTEMGVPTPNLFTGMQEIHGPLEWISVQDMAKATDLALHLARRAGQVSK